MVRKLSKKSFVTRFSSEIFVDLLIVVVGKYSVEHENTIASRRALADLLYTTFEPLLEELDHTPYPSHAEKLRARSRFENLLTTRMMSRAQHKGFFLSTPQMQEKYGYEGGTLTIELTPAGWVRYSELTKSGDLLKAMNTLTKV